MVPLLIKCENCNASLEIHTKRKYIKCPFCEKKSKFPGFEYEIEEEISKSLTSNVTEEMDCPACGSRHMFLLNNKEWRCIDCNYAIPKRKKNRMVFWYCDECEAFLNIQKGFAEDCANWKCTECGYENELKL